MYSIIAATSGGEDRSDKKISLWDVRSGNLIHHLSNTTTNKPILTVSFHPKQKNLLLTSDMEYDIKIWDWQSGVVLTSWKKAHSRIIHKCIFLELGGGEVK